ncbi:hypothetical protein DRO54_09800, partial [Candidatus Bathyarchaeota archaeon]
MTSKLEWLLVAESLFAGAYIALTRGLFLIFLVAVGQDVKGISFVILLSSLLSAIIGLMLYKQPNFLVRKVKQKLCITHFLERVTWFFIPLTSNLLIVSLLYSLCIIFSSFISTFLTFTIYGLLPEESIKKVTSRRTAAGNISSIIGFALGTFLLAFLQTNGKFIYIFYLGALIGILSTISVLFIDLSRLEGAKIPAGVKEPEKIFSTSMFFVIFLFAGNLLAIVWTPFLIVKLNSPEYLVALLNLAGTVSSIAASLFWGKRSLKMLRTGFVLNILSPILILTISIPLYHVGISIYNSFAFTAANFLGFFLFAKYNEWFGAVKSSTLIIVIGNIAQFMAAVFGMIIGANYLVSFLLIIVLYMCS